MLWTGEAISLLGNSTSGLLLPLVAVTQFHAGPGWMGLLTAAAWLPWLLIGLPAGAWVDVWNPRRVMLWADLGAAAATASVPLAWFLHLLSLPQMLVVALINGTCTVFFRAAYQRLLPRIVPAANLVGANSALQGTESATQLAGPSLAGLLAQLAGAAAGVLVDAVSFLVSAAFLQALRPSDIAADPQPQPAPEPLRRRIADGMRFVAGDRFLRAFTLIGGISNLGLTGYGTLLVLFMVEKLGLNAGTIGVLGTAASAGGVLGAFAAAPLSARLGGARALLILRTLGGPPALLIPFASSGRGVIFYVVGSFLVAFFVVAGNVLTGAFRQRYVPGPLMGRVVTSSQLVNFGTMPVAGLLAGWMGGQFGLRATMLMMAGIHTAACLGNLIGPLRGLRSLPIAPQRT
ncbi:MAG: MFS transporter [Actinomycetota bacterium]|nr:MFS transporter [Actinomycetota bacterium]